LRSNVLLLGGSGTLGQALIKSKLIKNLKYPSSKKVNILKLKEIENYILKNNINLILHFAALSKVKECERNKKKAYNLNVIGTGNVVRATKNAKNTVKLLFMSSDAVYPSTKGNYKETDKLKPYNFYGQTKLIGEHLVKLTKKYIIIRGRFFDKRKIPFKNSATNIFTSSLEVNEFIIRIYKLINRNFNGTVNIGGPKISDYKKYKMYKKKLIPCDKSQIFKNLNVKLATDASLNLTKFKDIK
tara:strand:+ start:218 stop:946 length:729 start_codon:yes stop_codon:yes gene_type:complete